MRVSGDSLVPQNEASLDFKSYTVEQLREINAALREFQRSLFVPTTVAPAKPRELMFRFADGVNWNPGSGKGLYQYYDGSWHMAKGEKGDPGQDGLPGVPGYTPNQLLAGGYVAWTSGYSFRVSAASYIIASTQYVSLESTITLDEADGTFDRIDVIAVDDSGAVVVIKGTPAESPARPDVDPATQLMLTFILVGAGTTEPPEVSGVDIYHENSEWTSSVTANFNANSTNNPHAGTKCIEATAAATGNYVQLAAASPVDLTGYNNLVFFIRSKATWNSKRQLQITWRNSGVQVGAVVTLKSGDFSFNSSNISDYQQIIIPLSLFAAPSSVTQLRITVAGSQTTLGFYVDDIILQGGIAPPVASNSMLWKGTWAATVSYPVNSVIKYNGSAYIALESSVGITPGTDATVWDLIVSGGSTSSDTVAALDGTGAAGAAATHSRGDHKHADAARHTHANQSALDAIAHGFQAALTAASPTKYFNAAAFSGAIFRYSLASLDGNNTTAVVEFWKSATPGPTAANSINTLGISISGAKGVVSTDVSDFIDTDVAEGDWYAAHLKSGDNVKVLLEYA